QKDSESLPDAFVERGVEDLFIDDLVGGAEQVQPLQGDFAQDAHRQTRSWERLALQNLRRDIQVASNSPHLVLEKLPQRLDELQVHFLRQAANVVMALDRRRGAAYRDGFDPVWIERSLN